MTEPATGAVAPKVEAAASGDGDRVLLEGPHSRTREFWLVVRAFRDFIAGFRALHFVGPCVTVFGSARFPPAHPYYALARDVGAAVTRRRVHGHDRGWSRPHGSGQPRRARGRRTLGRLQHRAAVRTGAQRVSGSLGHLPLLLRAQGAALQILLCLHRLARRAGHARRAHRGPDPRPDRQDRQLPHRPHRL